MNSHLHTNSVRKLNIVWGSRGFMVVCCIPRWCDALSFAQKRLMETLSCCCSLMFPVNLQLVTFVEQMQSVLFGAHKMKQIMCVKST